MAESIRQPDELVLSGNIAENWRKFKQEFELYMLAAGYDEKPSKQKIALLLHVARKQAIEVYNTFAFSEEEEGEYDSVIGKFDAYCNPKKNETYERYVFNSRKQLEGEAIEQFVTDLKLKAQTCQFDTLRDSMIRDRIVLGVWSQRVRERLLREDGLDLGKAVKICQAAEVTERQIETLSQKFSDGEANVHYNRGRHNPKHKPVQTHSKHKPKTNFTKCSCCDTAHAPRACPAFNKSCNACGKSGHFARVCRSKPKVRYVSRDESTDPTVLFVGMVKADHDTRDERWSQNLRVEGRTISFKLDTGSDVNIISELEYRTITPKPRLEKSETVMTSYSGGPIPSLGVCCVSVQYKKRHIYAYMEVVRDERRPALLGGTDCARLGLVKRVHAVTTKDMKSNILKSHPQLFHGSGSLPGVHTIVLKDDAAPVIHAPQRVAVAKRPQLKRELDRQVSQGFLAKVIEPTDWVNSLVIVEKANGQMRLCIDPKDLNKVVKRDHFQIPTKEEILGKLRDAKWFSKLDATAGFHQIKLDRPSSMLTTFNTPFGRYRYLGLPWEYALLRRYSTRLYTIS